MGHVFRSYVFSSHNFLCGSDRHVYDVSSNWKKPCLARLKWALLVMVNQDQKLCKQKRAMNKFDLKTD